MNQTIRTAIIGFGAIGKAHAASLARSADFALTACADPNIEQLRAEGLDPSVHLYADAAGMLASEPLDAVIVASPHHLHHEHTLAALEAGCHVMVEKPMAIDVGQCTEMIEAADRCDRQLMVAHTLHYFPTMRHLRELIGGGRIGEVVSALEQRCAPYVSQSRPAWYLHREAKGMFFNLGAHCIERLGWIMGAPVERVAARLSEEDGIDLGGSVLLTYRDGRSALVSMSGYSGGEPPSVTVLGRTGMIRGSFGSLEVCTGERFEPVQVPSMEPPGMAQLAEFAESIRQHRPSRTDGHAGREVVAVALAVYRAHETGQTIGVERNYER